MWLMKLLSVHGDEITLLLGGDCYLVFLNFAGENATKPSRTLGVIARN